MAVSYSKDKHDDYWKLGDYDYLTAKEMRALLQERHYNVGTLIDKQRLRVALRRTDLGLPSYHDSTIPEIQARLDARRLNEDKEQASRRRMLGWLDWADEHLSFHRFCQLPPELRNRVYACYYDEFRQPICAPSQPPLSRTCRQLRKESLPMFYDLCEFEFRFQRYNPEPTWRTHPSFWRLTISDRMLLFLHSSKAQHLAAIRRFRIVAEDQDHYSLDWSRWWLYSFRWEQANKLTVHREKIISQPEVTGWVGCSRAKVKWQQMILAVERVADVIESRTEKHKLRANDFFQLRKALELGLIG